MLTAQSHVYMRKANYPPLDGLLVQVFILFEHKPYISCTFSWKIVVRLIIIMNQDYGSDIMSSTVQFYVTHDYEIEILGNIFWKISSLALYNMDEDLER